MFFHFSNPSFPKKFKHRTDGKTRLRCLSEASDDGLKAGISAKTLEPIGAHIRAHLIHHAKTSICFEQENHLPNLYSWLHFCSFFGGCKIDSTRRHVNITGHPSLLLKVVTARQFKDQEFYPHSWQLYRNIDVGKPWNRNTLNQEIGAG